MLSLSLFLLVEMKIIQIKSISVAQDVRYVS